MIYRVDATHPKIKKNDEEDETKRTESGHKFSEMRWTYRCVAHFRIPMTTISRGLSEYLIESVSEIKGD